MIIYGRWSGTAGDPMKGPKPSAFTLFFAASLALGSSCSDDDDGEEPEQRPTQEQMQQVAADICEHGLACGDIPDDVTLEECVANRLDVYQRSPECVAVYYFNECLAMLTCQEYIQLMQFGMGQCLEERREASKLACEP